MCKCLNHHQSPKNSVTKSKTNLHCKLTFLTNHVLVPEVWAASAPFSNCFLRVRSWQQLCFCTSRGKDSCLKIPFNMRKYLPNYASANSTANCNPGMTSDACKPFSLCAKQWFDGSYVANTCVITRVGRQANKSLAGAARSCQRSFMFCIIFARFAYLASTLRLSLAHSLSHPGTKTRTSRALCWAKCVCVKLSRRV